MINYATLIAHVRPFFLSRGGDDLAGNDRMMFYANCSIQDIYNSDNATFTYKNEIIAAEANDATSVKFTTIENIRKVQQLIATFKNQTTMELTPTLWFPPEGDKSWFRFETGSNVIVADIDIVSIDVVYIKEYKWATYPANLNDSIQLPERYVPALIKFMYDWASPINLMSGETAVVDFFAHGASRMKQLSDEESLTDVYQLRTSR